jgi:uncharacterized tellurite resistance protein B-like protein
MKLSDRILVIVDLLMAGLSCDGTIVGEEDQAARRLLGELLLCKPDALPAHVEARIKGFRLIDFDMDATVQDFLSDPPMKKRRLLELIAKLSDADGQHDMRESDFIRDLARALGMAAEEYQDLVLTIEFEESIDERMKSMRDSFLELRISDLPAPPPEMQQAPIGGRKRTRTDPPPIPEDARKR